jgi:hypothetical protein
VRGPQGVGLEVGCGLALSGFAVKHLASGDDEWEVLVLVLVVGRLELLVTRYVDALPDVRLAARAHAVQVAGVRRERSANRQGWSAANPISVRI